MITLYKKHKSGIGYVNLWVAAGRLYYEYGITMDSPPTTHSEPIVLNNSGRNFAAQAELELNSRMNRYIQRGYKTSIETAESESGTNQLGLPLPMLAHPIERVSDLSGNLFVQRKYDGHRCLITRDGKDIIAYSRKGNLITTIEHILFPLQDVLPIDVVIDGELYCHGQPLQTIGSWVKRDQPNSKRLKFHAYDLISTEKFQERYHELRDILRNVSNNISIVETFQTNTIEYAYEKFREFRNEGYEGAILRRSVREYEAGRRSNQLLKIKERQDAEFEVIDVKPGKDNIGICVLKMLSGKTFDCLAPGTVPQKREVYEHRTSYIGRQLTVEYAGLTADGIPFHCVAIRFREDV